MDATNQVTKSFNGTRPKIAAADAGRYLRGQWGAYDVSTVIGQLLEPLYEAIYRKTDFGGQDPLEAVRGQKDTLADTLKRFLNGGRGIPQQNLDETLIEMVRSGSLTGVKICREAGADPYAFHEAHGVSAMDSAEAAGRLDMVAAMRTAPRTIAPVPAVA